MVVHEWLDWLHEAFGGARRTKKRRWLHRQFHLSGEMMAWLNAPERTREERCEFAELLLRLDADPVRHSDAVLRKGAPPGMRWAAFGVRRAIFVWSAAGDEIHVVMCV